MLKRKIKTNYHRASYGKLSRLPSHRRRSKGPYILGLAVILGISLYFFGPWSDVSGPKPGGNILSQEEKEKEKEPAPVPKKEPAALMAELETYLSQQVGTYGYTVIELDDGRQFGKRDGVYYTAASSIKVAIFAYLYDRIEAGAISPETSLTYTGADYEGGTGSLQADPVGSKYKISYLAERMIKVSDNVATNILIRHLGRTNIQNYLNTQGLAEIKMATNDVTPRSMAKLLKLIHNETLLNAANKKILLGYMEDSITPERLVAGVPKTVSVSHKIGSWSGAMSDIGIVFAENRPYAIAVYSEGVAWGAVTDAVIAKISQSVYNFETSF
jgi:beta-lactamase class A